MADMCAAERTKKYDIPLSHLDYKYVEKCSDVKELEKILKVLRSGEEGRYPDLEKTCEEKIEQIHPDSRLLRKDRPPAQPGDLDKEQWEIISDGLKDWTAEMKEKEESTGKNSVPKDDANLPPVRGSAVQISADIKTCPNNSKEQKTQKSVKPRDYREWDKFDIDKELKSVEENENTSVKGVQNTFRQTTLPQNLKTEVDVTGLGEEEKTILANREKDKGNEAFRSNDYLEAVVYYTRSIHCVPLPASYNNRALAYVKLSKWSEAVCDCNRVLDEEVDNVKAILRRGTAYKGLKEFQKARRDFEKVLELEPNNKRAKDLLTELVNDKQKDDQETEERKQKGRRMTIEEVEGSESEDEQTDAMTDVTSDIDKQSTTDTNPCSGFVNGQTDDSPAATETVAEEKDISVTSNSEHTTETQTHTESESKTDKDKETETESNSTAETPVASTGGGAVSAGGTPSDVTDGNVLCTSQTLDSDSPAAQLMARPALTQHPLSSPVAELREAGNTLFRSGQYGEAIDKYTTAIDLLLKGGTEQTVNLSLLHSNRAACKLKIGDCVGAIEDCTEALRLVPHSVKPLLRRAQAYETTERYRKAYVDFKHVLSIDNSYDIAFQGARRCTQMLLEQDGPKWREKLPEIPRVAISDIPIIHTTSSPHSVNTSPIQSPSSPLPPSNTAMPKTTSDNNASHSSETAEQLTQSDSKPLSPDEEFDQKKAEGNHYVQKGEFRQAEDCYTACIKLFPDRLVAFTNRALCYLRLNQASKAEEDCTRALTLDSQNVKALFRRAQARKMLGQYKHSLSDLTQLLKLDSKNSAAKREMDVVKQYYREELEKLKTLKSGDRAEGDDTQTHIEGGTKKQRKRVVIEEVEGDSNDTSGNKTLPKDNKTEQSKQEKTKSTSRKSQGKPTGDGVKENKTHSSGKSCAKAVRVPKLIKVTPYEFMQAWNSLKSVKDIEPYARLLEQVPPDDIASVISNKLDADMLSKIIASATEYFIPKGQPDLAYRLLSNLCKVPRFQTMAMFMSSQEKQDLSSLFDKIDESLNNGDGDIDKLRANYGLRS